MAVLDPSFLYIATKLVMTRPIAVVLVWLGWEGRESIYVCTRRWESGEVMDPDSWSGLRVHLIVGKFGVTSGLTGPPSLVDFSLSLHLR